MVIKAPPVEASYGVHDILKAAWPLAVQCNLLQVTNSLQAFPSAYGGAFLSAPHPILTPILLTCLSSCFCNTPTCKAGQAPHPDGFTADITSSQVFYPKVLEPLLLHI